MRKYAFPCFTQGYKGCWIHQYSDGSISWQTPDDRVFRVKSWRAAQIAITRWKKRTGLQ